VGNILYLLAFLLVVVIVAIYCLIGGLFKKSAHVRIVKILLYTILLYLLFAGYLSFSAVYEKCYASDSSQTISKIVLGALLFLAALFYHTDSEEQRHKDHTLRIEYDDFDDAQFVKDLNSFSREHLHGDKYLLKDFVESATKERMSRFKEEEKLKEINNPGDKV